MSAGTCIDKVRKYFDGWKAPEDCRGSSIAQAALHEAMLRGSEISATRRINDEKPTNPKDAIGSKKLLLSLVPSTLIVEVALAFLEGALKYGRFNWRIAGVRSSIYYDALMRHIEKWWNGQDCDPVTRVKHLANAAACIAILLDAALCGKLTDDRPPRAPIDKLIDDSAEGVAHLQELFKDHKPQQFTIKDGVQS